MQLSVSVRPVAFYVFFEKRNNVFGFRDLSVSVSVSQISYKFGGGFHTDIVAYERFFELIEKVFVDASAESQNR